ncbi:hypothetical protein K4P65_04525 [Staphylococcus epidermidis]|nr:hypothetical protein [Staphylococcus epidermidis]
MKKVLFLIFASLLVLGACGQDGDKSNKDDNKQSEHKKSNDTKKNKDEKADNKKDSKNNSSKDKQQANSDSNVTSSNESQSTSKNDNGKAQDNNGNNERTQGKQAQATQQNNNQQQSNNQQSQNNNGYMTQEQINEWNKNKPTTHDESQMGYERGDYEQARKDSEKVWNDPNAHVGGPRWVEKNEGYESWAKRQQEVQNTTAE